MNKWLALTLLLVIIGFGAFFRLNHINDESLWLDEGVSYYNSSSDIGLSGVWNKTAILDQSPPAYYLIMHEYLKITGEDEFYFRLVPVIFGSISILFLFLLIGVMFNWEAGLFAAILLAINPFHIGFSMESRQYVLLSLESLAGFICLFKGITHKNSGLLWWFLFSIVSILGFYTHNFYFFIMLAFGFIYLLYWLFEEKKAIKFLMGMLSVLLIVLAYLPWIPSFLKQLSVERYWIADIGLADMKTYFLDYIGGSEIAAILILGLMLLGFLWGILSVKSDRYKFNVLGVIALCTFVGISLGAPLFYSMNFDTILKIRYTVYVVPIILGLAGYGLYAFRKASLVLPIFIILLLIFISKPWELSVYPMEIGEDFRTLVKIVNNNPAPLIVHSPSTAHVINFYNTGNFGVHPFPNSDDLRFYNIDEKSKENFMDLIFKFDHFYLMTSHSHENPLGILKKWSEEKCGEGENIEIRGMELNYFDECS